MKQLVVLACMLGAIKAEAPLYPQVRFQPLQNIVVLPSTSQQLKELAHNTTKQQDTKPKDGVDERRVVTMEELRAVDGSVTGSYHVLLENGKLQRVDFTAAPRLPEVQVQPQLRSWYYTQVPADVLQRYYAEYYAQQNAQYKRPAVSQGANSNSQGVSQSAGHGVNVASNHNVQTNQQKQGNSHYETAASHLVQQTVKASFPLNSGSSGNQQNTQSVSSGQRVNSGEQRGFGAEQRGFSAEQRGFGAEQRGFGAEQRGFGAEQRGFGTEQRGFGAEQRGFGAEQRGFGAEQRIRGKDEVETFEPVQGRKESRDEYEYPPNSVVATIYYTDVSPITGPIYTFDQTPLVRILRQA